MPFCTQLKKDVNTLLLLHCNEGTGGTLHDVSGKGLTLTAASPTWVPVSGDGLKTCLTFNSAASGTFLLPSVSVPLINTDRPAGDFTIEAIVSTVPGNQEGYFGVSGAGTYGCYMLYNAAPARPCFVMGGGPTDVTVVPSAGINDGKLHHFAGVRRGGTAYLYADGVQLATAATGTAAFNTTNRNLIVGARGESTVPNYATANTKIYEIRISNVARAPGEFLHIVKRMPQIMAM